MAKVFVTVQEAEELKPLFIDCRFMLTDPSWGRREYEKEHITGAVYAHLDDDLSSPVTAESGRHPLPELEDFVGWVRKMGIDETTKVVAYDNFNGGLAARLWWLLRQIGIEDVFIMTEGLEEWKEEGQVTSDKQPSRSTSSFQTSISSWQEGQYNIKSLGDIENMVPSEYLIDSRDEERYRGEIEPYDEIAGHIPGAVNLPWSRSVGEEKLPVKDLMGGIKSVIDPNRSKEYTVYCGSGVTACFNLAVFEALGLDRPSIFPGSYSEWSRNHPDMIDTSHNNQ